MGTTAEKLTHLSQTKSDIRDAIEAKGVSVPVETTFRDYATKVSDIKTDFSDTFNYAERVSQDGGSVENLAEVANLDFNDGATLNFIPAGKKAGKSYSQLPVDGSGDWTVDRNCEATYIDKDGVVQTAQANEPRYDWSSGSPVLLRERQSTNVMKHSQINDPYHYLFSVEFTTNIETFLDGTQVYEINRTGEYNHARIEKFFDLPSSTYTTSVYAKAGMSNIISLRLDTGSGFDRCYFDLNTGSISNNTASNATITYEKDGWYRCSITTNGAINYARLYLMTEVSGEADLTEPSTTYFAGWQLEEGSKTSYIKTEGATVTRLADIIETTPPAGTTQIIETIDGVEQSPIATIPATYQIPEGHINQIKML